MKRPLYTRAYDPGLLERAGRPEEIMTAEEHAFLSEGQIGRHFSSRSALVNWYATERGPNLEAVPFLLKYAAESGSRRLLSLGAGAGVLEFFLALGTPEGGRVFASDYDAFVAEKAAGFFPEVSWFRHDFAAEGVGPLFARMGGAPDLAVFFGSSYVLDDGPFTALFAALREAGTRRIVDFQAGFMDARACVRRWAPFEWLRGVPFLRRAAGREFRGKFHGYQRSRGHLRALYHRAGFAPVREARLAGYSYVAVCEAR